MEGLYLNNIVEATAGMYERIIYSDALYKAKEHFSRNKGKYYLTAAVIVLFALTSGCAGAGPVGNVFTDTRDAIGDAGRQIKKGSRWLWAP